jgi:enamine deaminase RidA (YjgF/YER057c/UK114 family)
MLQRSWGRVVNVASIAGLHGARYVSHYSAAKHAVVGFTRSIALEFAGKGVTANAVCPGYVDTPMTARAIENVQARAGLGADDALAAVLESAGQQRLVTPVEVATKVVQLCTEEAALVNGEAIVLDGRAGGAMQFDVVNPESLGEPKGWNNGMLASRGGRVLFVAGQPGWDASVKGSPPGFADQFATALDKVLAVVGAAGGSPQDVGRMTVYVTHLAAYRDSLKALGALWRPRFGKYYPAMALVEVKGLVDQGAVVEIEATAVIGGER